MFLFQIENTRSADSLLTGGIGSRGEDTISLFDMLLKGGPVMIPLALLLIMALYIFFERWLTLMKIQTLNEAFLNNLRDSISRGDLKSALQLCEAQPHPEALMLAQGIRRIGQPMTEIRSAMQQAGMYEVSLLERNLGILQITGRIAPIFGFIGTIIGVIKIFYDISLAKTVEIEVISTGLYQKMMASAVGLIVGLLAFVFYHILNSRIDKIVQHQEKIQMQFLNMLNEV